MPQVVCLYMLHFHDVSRSSRRATLIRVCNTTALGTWAVRPATSDMVQMVGYMSVRLVPKSVTLNDL